MVNTVYELVKQMESFSAEAVAFQYFENGAVKKVCYRQYCEDIRRVASCLREQIPETNKTHIGFLAGTSYQYMVCLFAAMFAGAVVVPLNPRESMENLRYELRNGDVSYLFVDAENDAPIENFDINVKSIDALYAMQPSVLHDFQNVNPDCLAMIIYTSGTTGANKGAMLSQKNMFAGAGVTTRYLQSVMDHLGVSHINTLLTVPTYHIYAMVMITASAMKGTTLNLCLSIKDIGQDLIRMHNDYAPTIPSLCNIWHKDIIRGKQSRLGAVKVIITSGAFVDVSKFKDFQEAGILIGQCYGMTETAGGITAFHTSFHGNTLNAVGKPDSSLEVKIEDGEICVRGDAVTCGYYKDPVATAMAIKDGWLHTGDLGRFDEEGYLYLTGRKKNLIILSNGENISPEELEEEILRNPLIIEAVIKEKNEKICAEIYCMEKDQPEIRSFIEQHNRGKAFYKRITEIDFRQTPFVKGATGKILRK